MFGGSSSFTEEKVFRNDDGKSQRTFMADRQDSPGWQTLRKFRRRNLFNRINRIKRSNPAYYRKTTA